MKTTLSNKDEEFRRFALNGNMGRLMLQVCLPLTLYQSLNQLFKMLDTMLASYISSSTVTTVAYLSQISMMLSALGGGLAIGASIKVSEAFGLGDFEMVKKRVNTLFALCAVLGGTLLLILVPFAPEFLRIFHTPEALIAQGTTYFILELVGMVISFFNSVYIAIERARGNSKRIFWLNICATITKLGLSAIFVFGWEPLGFGAPGINLLSTASLLSNGVILAAAVLFMNQKGNAFGFSLRAVSFKREVTVPMLSLSFPVIVERFAFSLGKVLINAMCADPRLDYQPDTVGATSVSNHISGITLTPQNGFQEGGSAIISQNLGAGKPERVVSAFKWMLAADLIMGFAMMSLSLIFLYPLCMLSAANNAEFAGMIARIYRYEAIAVIPLGVNSAVLGLLYGLGKTKITLVMNFCRVFVFRLPILWFLQNFTERGRTDGPNTIGTCLAVSNILCGIMAVIIAAIVVRRFCQRYQISFRSGDYFEEKRSVRGSCRWLYH